MTSQHLGPNMLSLARRLQAFVIYRIAEKLDSVQPHYSSQSLVTILPSKLLLKNKMFNCRPDFILISFMNTTKCANEWLLKPLHHFLKHISHVNISFFFFFQFQNWMLACQQHQWHWHKSHVIALCSFDNKEKLFLRLASECSCLDSMFYSEVFWVPQYII